MCPDVGGGFGPRTSLYPEQVVVCWAARRLGRPVRWTSDRSEAFLTDFQGRDSCVARLGLDAGSHPRARVDFAVNVGGQTVSYVPLSNAAASPHVYDIGAARARARGADPHGAHRPYRGAGRPEAIFIVERLLDLAAAQLGMDRVDLRRRNLIARATPLSLGGRTDLRLRRLRWQHAARARDVRLGGLSQAPRGRLRRGKLAGIGLANYVESPVGAPHERVSLTRHQMAVSSCAWARS